MEERKKNVRENRQENMRENIQENRNLNLGSLKTEGRNSRTTNLDLMSPMEIISVMNDEDRRAVDAVGEALPQIERAILLVIRSLNQNGRLIYAGAGTSGRLGILDAVECGPTFSAGDRVIGVIAGGEKAFTKAVEGAEDSEELAAADLDAVGVCEKDVVVAITASGRTPYAIGALKHAREKNAACIGISCNTGALLSQYADVAIEVDAGPEVLAGSTRLKAGTCQKIILNMISTAAMAGIGKVYGNLMVDMKAGNQKLMERAKKIVMESTGCDAETADETLAATGYDSKVAIVMILAGVTKEEASARLAANQGFIRKCIE